MAIRTCLPVPPDTTLTPEDRIISSSSLSSANTTQAIARRACNGHWLVLALLGVCFSLPAHAQHPNISSHSGSTVLLNAMQQELDRAMQSLGHETPPSAGSATATQTGQPPYFLSYSVAEASSLQITAQYGGITSADQNKVRMADVQIRVGKPQLDNTHGDHRSSATTSVLLPLGDDSLAIRHALWRATNKGYGEAINNYLKVQTESQVRTKEEDQSADFTTEKPQTNNLAPEPVVSANSTRWEERLRQISQVFRHHPDIYMDQEQLQIQTETDYYVSSEGSQLTIPSAQARLVVVATTRADDGMELFRVATFEATSDRGLPSDAEMERSAEELATSLEQLRRAPVTEPFNGPAILSGRASAVFFHEVLGHRLEGQRQRGDEEGQTFTHDIGKPILPPFLSVADDPTMTTFNGTQLSGTYTFDDEGQPARRVALIQDGVLQQFLMSRLPIAGSLNSNGHGRHQQGRMPTGRQGNLIVSSSKTVPDSELKDRLREEAKKQGKPYGLYFEDISSGFAVTERSSPQAFQVIPLVVYRVYVDGRPDELVRGVSIVGTPQAALNRILLTGNHSQVFNGECGAESGTVPVSAVAPPMLVSEIETQRQPKGSSRPPILPNPGALPPTPGTSEKAARP